MAGLIEYGEGGFTPIQTFPHRGGRVKMERYSVSGARFFVAGPPQNDMWVEREHERGVVR